MRATVGVWDWKVSYTSAAYSDFNDALKFSDTFPLCDLCCLLFNPYFHLHPQPFRGLSEVEQKAGKVAKKRGIIPGFPTSIIHQPLEARRVVSDGCVLRKCVDLAFGSVPSGPRGPDYDGPVHRGQSRIAITRPLRILGSNQVDLGGMNLFCSHTAQNWSIVTGASEMARSYSPASTRDCKYAASLFPPT